MVTDRQKACCKLARRRLLAEFFSDTDQQEMPVMAMQGERGRLAVWKAMSGCSMSGKGSITQSDLSYHISRDFRCLPEKYHQ